MPRRRPIMQQQPPGCTAKLKDLVLNHISGQREWFTAGGSEQRKKKHQFMSSSVAPFTQPIPFALIIAVTSDVIAEALARTSHHQPGSQARHADWVRVSSPPPHAGRASARPGAAGHYLM